MIENDPDFRFQFSSVAQSSPTLCEPMDCSTPGFLFTANSYSLLKLMSIESVMPSNHLIFCCLLLLLPSIFPSIRIFSNQSALCISIQRKSCSFLNGAKKKKKIPQTSKQKQPKKQVRFCHRMWHLNSRCNNLVRNSWQLIQSFIWRLNTMGTVSSTCARWSVKKKLSQSVHLHLKIPIYKSQMAVGVWLRAARALKIDLSVHLRHAIKAMPALSVNEPKSKPRPGMLLPWNKEWYAF